MHTPLIFFYEENLNWISNKSDLTARDLKQLFMIEEGKKWQDRIGKNGKEKNIKIFKKILKKGLTFQFCFAIIPTVESN